MSFPTPLVLFGPIIIGLYALIVAPLFMHPVWHFPFHTLLLDLTRREVIAAVATLLALLLVVTLRNPAYRRFARTGVWRQYIVHIPKLFHIVPIIVGVAAFALFASAGQMQEVYLTIVENDARLQFIVGLLVICALSAANFYADLRLTRPYADASFGGTSIPLQPPLRIARQVVALMCGLAPLGGLFVGFWRSQERLSDTIRSAWAATRNVADSGPLTIPVFAYRGGNQILHFAWSLEFLLQATILFVVLSVVIVVAQMYCWMLLGLPKGRKRIIAQSIIAALCTTALVAILINLPSAWAPGQDIAITDLARVSNYFTGTVLLAMIALAIMLIAWREASSAAPLVWLVCAVLTIIALLVPPLSTADNVVNYSRFVGPLAMAALQFMTFFTIVVFLVHCSLWTGVPWIMTLAAFIVVRAWFNAGNAPVRQIGELASSTDKPAVDTQSLDLKGWFEADVRKTRRDAYEKLRATGSSAERRFPVFVIAVQGGGIYAASAAAMFLSKLEETCPGFHHHVFAISAVSGGAVGAAGFSALARTTKVASDPTCGAGSLPPPPRNKSDTDKSKKPPTVLDDAAWIATQDHISPVLALLAPEYAEKVFWVSPRGVRAWFSNNNQDLTRANALEKSLACAFHARPSMLTQQTCVSSNLDKVLEAYRSHFDQPKPAQGAAPTGPPPPPPKGAPALILNTTFVETGQRVAFSPFPLSKLGDPHLTSFAELDGVVKKKLLEVSLPEAAVASARFPGLMPAYSLELEAPKRGHWNFVDGGYTDNSGAATALAIVRKLKEQSDTAKLTDKIDIKLIILTSEIRKPDLVQLQGTTLVDSRAPVEALLNVRSTLAVREIDRAVAHPAKEWDIEKRRTNWDVGIIRLDDKNFSLQLGWSLSRTTNHIISLFVTRPEYCTGSAATKPPRLPAATKTGESKAGEPKTEEDTSSVETTQEQTVEIRAERITQNACLIKDVLDLLKAVP